MTDTPATLPTINIDALFEAMTIGDNVVAYLDPATGAIELFPKHDGDDDPVDRDAFENWHVVDQVEKSRRYRWMREFAVSLADAPDIAQILDGHPDLRARWNAFRAERLLECAKSWMADQGLDHALSESRAVIEEAIPPGTVEIGLIHMLLLGAPDGKTELLDGKVSRVIRASSARQAKQLFGRFARHACGLSGIDYRSPVDGRNALTLGELELELRGSTVEVRVAVSGGVWDAFS